LFVSVISWIVVSLSKTPFKKQGLADLYHGLSEKKVRLVMRSVDPSATVRWYGIVITVSCDS